MRASPDTVPKASEVAPMARHSPSTVVLLLTILWTALEGFPGPSVEDALVTRGSFAAEEAVATPPDGLIRLVSYNLHGPPTSRIEAMIEMIRTHSVVSKAHVFALQEVNRGHKGSGNKDMGLELAQALGMHYVYAVEIEHDSGGGVRGLALLSRFPLREVERILLPVEGPGGRRRIALGATVDLNGSPLRVYTTHLETRISPKERGQQIQGMLENVQKYADLPTAVLGDFNTYTSSHTRTMFDIMEAAGLACPLEGNKNTFGRMRFLRLKLDWIWVRGIQVRKTDVETDIKISDHRPLWMDIELPPKPDSSER